MGLTLLDSGAWLVLGGARRFMGLHPRWWLVGLVVSRAKREGRNRICEAL